MPLSSLGFRAFFEASPAPMLVVAAQAPHYSIVAVNDAYLQATMTSRDGPQGLIGRPMFEAFPDPPDDPDATGTRNLRQSFERAIRTRLPDTMAIQHYDIRRPDGSWERRDWSPVNTPVLDPDGRMTHIVHRVEDVTEVVRLAKREREHLQTSRVLERLREEMSERRRADAERSDLRRRLDSAQEDERRRISRELHDRLGAHLAALNIGLVQLRKRIPEPSLAENMQQLHEIVGMLTSEVRTLALELRPMELDDLGLYSALTTYAEQWSTRFGVPVDIHTEGLENRRLPDDVETTLYRAVQEGLTNVARHASARRAGLIVRVERDSVFLAIEDDGRGFDVESTRLPGTRRLGLPGIAERVALVGGASSVESAPGRGTALLVRIPRWNAATA